ELLKDVLRMTHVGVSSPGWAGARRAARQGAAWSSVRLWPTRPVVSHAVRCAAAIAGCAAVIIISEGGRDGEGGARLFSGGFALVRHHLAELFEGGAGEGVLVLDGDDRHRGVARVVELGRDLVEEAARRAWLLRGPRGAGPRARQVEDLSGARDADVHEAAL